MVEALQEEVRELKEVYAYNQDKMLRALCATSRVDIASLNLRTPGTLSDVDETGVGTPPAPSVISTVSSTSESFYLDRLTMENRNPQIMGPPSAGPLERSRDVRTAQGALFYHSLVLLLTLQPFQLPFPVSEAVPGSLGEPPDLLQGLHRVRSPLIVRSSASVISFHTSAYCSLYITQSSIVYASFSPEYRCILCGTCDVCVSSLSGLRPLCNMSIEEFPVNEHTV
jgi:hypothetical protein